jgi:NAD(P)H-hydrate epimerase
MGDVLSGLTAGLLAQFPRYPLIEAVALHAAAGDLAAAQGQRGMTALDVIEQIRAVVSA